MKSLEELRLKDKKVVIFDLDGTLIDSIGVWNMTDQKLIHDYSGIDVELEKVQADRDYFLNNNPSSDIYTAYCEYLINKYGLSIDNPSELSDIRKDTANEVLKDEIGFKPDV
jgi:phosphoglycolate phosphatase-like HAD superfamily hydrolase